MRHLPALALLVVAAIHLMPTVGVLGAARLAALYGVDAASDPNLLLLLRHRAVLFGLLGGFMLLAAFVPRLQNVAFAVGAVSVLSFLLLALTSSGLNAHVLRVMWVDVVALVVLVIGAAARAWASQPPAPA